MVTHQNIELHQDDECYSPQLFVLLISVYVSFNLHSWSILLHTYRWNWASDTFLEGPTGPMTESADWFYTINLLENWRSSSLSMAASLGLKFIRVGKAKSSPACWMRPPAIEEFDPAHPWMKPKPPGYPRKPPGITTTSVITVIWPNPIIALPESRQRDPCTAPNSVLINDISEFFLPLYL